MRIILLAFLILLTSAAESFAVHPPSTSQMQSLQTQLNAIQTLQGTEDERNPKKRTGILGLAQDIEIESRKIDPDKKKLLVMERQLNTLKAQRAVICQKLIDDTRAWYDIKPHRWSAEIVLNGDFNKTRANWSPKFGDWVEKRTAPNRNSDRILMTYSGPYSAVTWGNGDIVITIDAFAFSPGYLAAVIKHETVHFDQITTRGRGDKMSPAGRENEAYHAMQGLNSSIFNLSPSEEAAIKVNFENALKRTSSLPNSPLGASGFESINLTENPDGEEILRKRIEEAKSLAKESRQRVEQERRSALIQRLQTSYSEIAKRACENPGSVSQAELDALPSSREMEDRSTPEGLTPCEKEIYQGLMNGANADDLVRYATPVVPAIPSITYPPLPQPPVAYVPADVSKSLGEILPGLKEFAEMACKYGGHIPAPKGFFAPRQPYAVTSIDDAAADKMKAGLGRCESHVFGRLYEALRDGRGDLITEQWFIDAVASTPTQISPPANNGGYFPPPQNGGGGRNPCEVNGDPFGCQPRR